MCSAPVDRIFTEKPRPPDTVCAAVALINERAALIKKMLLTEAHRRWRLGKQTDNILNKKSLFSKHIGYDMSHFVHQDIS